MSIPADVWMLVATLGGPPEFDALLRLTRGVRARLLALCDGARPCALEWWEWRATSSAPPRGFADGPLGRAAADRLLGRPRAEYEATRLVSARRALLRARLVGHAGPEATLRDAAALYPARSVGTHRYPAGLGHYRGLLLRRVCAHACDMARRGAPLGEGTLAAVLLEVVHYALHALGDRRREWACAQAMLEASAAGRPLECAASHAAFEALWPAALADDAAKANEALARAGAAGADCRCFLLKAAAVAWACSAWACVAGVHEFAVLLHPALLEDDELAELLPRLGPYALEQALAHVACPPARVSGARAMAREYARRGSWLAASALPLAAPLLDRFDARRDPFLDDAVLCALDGPERGRLVCNVVCRLVEEDSVPAAVLLLRNPAALAYLAAFLERHTDLGVRYQYVMFAYAALQRVDVDPRTYPVLHAALEEEGAMRRAIAERRTQPA